LMPNHIHLLIERQDDFINRAVGQWLLARTFVEDLTSMSKSFSVPRSPE
jgi:REP element-mobilizing transposase RayT